jgi:hypothetical protein
MGIVPMETCHSPRRLFINAQHLQWLNTNNLQALDIGRIQASIKHHLFQAIHLHLCHRNQIILSSMIIVPLIQAISLIHLLRL